MPNPNEIPHVGKAELALQRVEQEANWYEGVGQDAGDTAAVARAQVSATLALVEAQETANLIAYQANVEASYATKLLKPRTADALALNQAILDRLGLS